MTAASVWSRTCGKAAGFDSSAHYQIEDRVYRALMELPKAELHLHIEGTLEPELAFEFARRNSVTLPWQSLDELRREYNFTSLQSFLDLYYVLMGTLRTAEDFTDLAMTYMRRAHSQGVRHVELFFDPQVHMRNGIAYETVLDGLLAAIREAEAQFGITAGLILCIIRDLPVEDAQRLFDQAVLRKHDVLGIGLDSAEVGYPPALFADIYAQARTLGWHVVAHAGEEGPAEYVRQALDLLHVERIDHGIHAADKRELIERCAYEHIGLTCCPLSNRRLQVVQDVRELPLHELLTAGVAVSVHSDDPAYFGGYIADNYLALAEAGYTLRELAQCARNSVITSFIHDDERESLIQEIADWEAKYL